MTTEERDAIIWGPLRLALGVLQLTFVPLSLYLLVTRGIKDLSTWAMIIFTMSVTIVSRLLYGGRKGPSQN